MEVLPISYRPTLRRNEAFTNLGMRLSNMPGHQLIWLKDGDPESPSSDWLTKKGIFDPPETPPSDKENLWDRVSKEKAQKRD